MANVTYADKAPGSAVTAGDLNQIKTAVNSKLDEDDVGGANGLVRAGGDGRLAVALIPLLAALQAIATSTQAGDAGEAMVDAIAARPGGGVPWVTPEDIEDLTAASGLTVATLTALVTSAVNMTGEDDPNLGGAIKSLLATSNPEALLSKATLADALGDVAGDTALAAAMGIDVRTALTAMVPADVRLFFQAMMTVWGRSLVTTALTGVNAGDLAVYGNLITGSDKLRELGAVTPASIPSAFNGFAHTRPEGVTNAGKVEWLSHFATALLLEEANPISVALAPVVATAGVVNYDANAIRAASMNTGVALALSPLIWANLKRGSRARLTINNTSGAAVNLTLQSTPEDGHRFRNPSANSGLPYALPVGKT